MKNIRGFTLAELVSLIVAAFMVGLFLVGIYALAHFILKFW